jgi:hypothetical protein
MAQQKKRTARIASVALLGSTVFANPPPVLNDKPREVIINRPNPASDRKPDAGTPAVVSPPEPPTRRPVIINRMQVRPEHVLLPDGGEQQPTKK